MNERKAPSHHIDLKVISSSSEFWPLPTSDIYRNNQPVERKRERNLLLLLLLLLLVNYY